MIEQHKTLTEKFLKKGIWLYLFSFVIAPIGYIIKIIVSGEITVGELGMLYGVLSLVGLLAGFNDFGMTESLNYFIPKYLEKKNYAKIKSLLAYAFITQMITGLIIAFILFFGADYLSIHYFKSEIASNILKIFAIYFLGINIFQVFNNFFLSVQNTFFNKITEMLRMIFILSFTIFLFLFDLGNVVTYGSAWVVGMYFGVIFVIYFFYKHYYKKYLSGVRIIWSRKLFKKIFSYAILVFVGSQAGSILSQIDMQMVIYLLGATDAGYYTNYLSIIAIPFMIIGPIFGLLFPIFSEMHAKKDIEQIKIVKQILSKNFIAVAIAFNIMMFVFAEPIAYTLFGEKYLTSGIILKYSILFLVFNFLLQINFSILAGIGKIKERVKIIFIAIIFNFILNIVLIKTIGVGGAALASGLGWILIYLMSEYFLGRKYFIKYNVKFLTKNIIFLGLLGIFCYYFIQEKLIEIERIYTLGVMCAIGIFWFGIFSAINIKEFKIFILEIKRLKKGKGKIY